MNKQDKIVASLTVGAIILIALVVHFSTKWGIESRTPDGMQWHEEVIPARECVPANGGRYDYGYYCTEATPIP